MPLGRILLSSISESKKMSKLKSDGARLLYTWLLAHLDINGCYSAEPLIIKSKIFTRLNKPLKTIASYLEDLEDTGLIIRYQANNDNYLIVPDFTEKQPYLNPDREAKPVIPTPTPEQLLSNSGVNNEEYTLNVKDKVKVNIKVKENEDSPKILTRNFFNAVSINSKEFQGFVNSLAEKNGSDPKDIIVEMKKFTSYWTEKSQNGQKERWELQRTFEVNRRLATWFGNINRFAGFTTQIKKGREIIGL